MGVLLMRPQGHGGAADATAGTWGLLLMGTQGPMLDAVMIIFLFDFGQDRLWRGSHQGYGGNLVTTIGI